MSENEDWEETYVASEKEEEDEKEIVFSLKKNIYSAESDRQQQEKSRSHVLRRNPGANDMHRSALVCSQQVGKTSHSSKRLSTRKSNKNERTNDSFLRLGTTLMTPDDSMKGKKEETSSRSSCKVSPDLATPRLNHETSSMKNRSSMKQNKRSGHTYTPAGLALSRNSHLDINESDLFSPNTLCLTESLDDLFREEGEDEEQRKIEGKDEYYVASAVPTPISSDDECGVIPQDSTNIKFIRERDFSEESFEHNFSETSSNILNNLDTENVCKLTKISPDEKEKTPIVVPSRGHHTPPTTKKMLFVKNQNELQQKYFQVSVGVKNGGAFTPTKSSSIDDLSATTNPASKKNIDSYTHQGAEIDEMKKMPYILPYHHYGSTPHYFYDSIPSHSNDFELGSSFHQMYPSPNGGYVWDYQCEQYTMVMGNYCDNYYQNLHPQYWSGCGENNFGTSYAMPAYHQPSYYMNYMNTSWPRNNDSLTPRQKGKFIGDASRNKQHSEYDVQSSRILKHRRNHKKNNRKEKLRYGNNGPFNQPKENRVTKRNLKKNNKTIDYFDRKENLQLPNSCSALDSHAKEIFYRTFREEERKSQKKAEEYALLCLKNDKFPSKLHWRVYLKLADLAKRSNNRLKARKLYRDCCRLQSVNSQTWLEYSKLEEENGNWKTSEKILLRGLSFCKYDESLIKNLIKLEEKMECLDKAREILSYLRNVRVEYVWRTILEGALLEARAGNIKVARKIMKFLMGVVPSHGPLYLEAYKLERNTGRPSKALAVIERGLKVIPRSYGPLWFGALRICEVLDINENSFHLPRTMIFVDRARELISQELLWKIYLEASKIHERTIFHLLTINPHITLNDHFQKCRYNLALTILTCPKSLRWKVWLAGGKLELTAGRFTEARQLFLHAYEISPEKGRSIALIECARLEEFLGNLQLTRAILCKARMENSAEWKVWLENVAVESRNGERENAIILVKRALDIHTGTGKLWTFFLQLLQPDVQSKVLREALRNVPKSGEVWCESARMHMNPFSPTFDLSKAHQHLLFAKKFTPQYGDSFIESLRLLLLNYILKQIETYLHDLRSKIFQNENDVFNTEIERFVVEYACKTAASITKKEHTNEFSIFNLFTGDTFDDDICQGLKQLNLFVSNNTTTKNVECVDFSELELQCTNADPNYGPLWLYSREPTDNAVKVLHRAKKRIFKDLKKSYFYYTAAIIRREGIAVVIRRNHMNQNLNYFNANQIPMKASNYSSMPNSLEEGSKEWDEILESRLRSTPLIDEYIEKYFNCHSAIEFCHLSSSYFVTGLIDFNKREPLQNMSSINRRKILFEGDSVLY